MFWSLYEITTYGHIAKQVFAKIQNSMMLSQEATREKVKWVVWRGGKENPPSTRRTEADGGILREVRGTPLSI